MLANSLTLHLMTQQLAAQFVATNKLQKFISIVASILDTEEEDVLVLSLFDEIYPHTPPAMNITLVARMRNGSFFNTAQLRARIALDLKLVWQIAAVLPPMDKLCRYETCDEWKDCIGIPMYRDTLPTVISPSYSFMSIKWERQYSCSCPPGYSGNGCETYYDYCNGDPCQRYGRCRSVEQGPYCECADGYVGKR